MNFDIAQHPAIERTRRAASSARLGTLLFVGSAVMLFVGLIVSSVLLRINAHNFKGMPPPPATGLVAEMATLVAALALIRLAAVGCRNRVRVRLRAGLLLAFAAGVLYLTLLAVHWSVAAEAGVVPRQNVRAGTYYLLTGAHALHLLGGMVPLGIWLARSWRRPFDWLAPGSLDALGLYWWFVAIVGAAVATFVYII